MAGQVQVVWKVCSSRSVQGGTATLGPWSWQGNATRQVDLAKNFAIQSNLGALPDPQLNTTHPF